MLISPVLSDQSGTGDSLADGRPYSFLHLRIVVARIGKLYLWIKKKVSSFTTLTNECMGISYTTKGCHEYLATYTEPTLQASRSKYFEHDKVYNWQRAST